MRAADPEAVRRVRDDLEALPAREPIEGALAVNVRNILEAMAPVAAVQPIRVRSRRDLEASSSPGA